MKGVYVLIISVSKDVKVKTGALDSLNFSKGLYAYVGSAQNNLEKRIMRHLRKAKPKFWHIDYLLENEAAKVLKIFVSEAGKFEECKIARRIGKRAVPVLSFGSSDCRCKGHLFRLESHEFLVGFMHEIVVPSH